MIIIQHHELMYNKYDIDTLEYNIDRLGLRRLLITQKLTADFCVKYLLNPEEHGMCVEDQYISKDDILLYQKHITKEELEILFIREKLLEEK
jgi:hypothetical protein